MWQNTCICTRHGFTLLNIRGNPVLFTMCSILNTVIDTLERIHQSPYEAARFCLYVAVSVCRCLQNLICAVFNDLNAAGQLMRCKLKIGFKLSPYFK